MNSLFTQVWNWLLSPFDPAYGGQLLQNALWELILISIIGGVIGTYIVLRGLVFIVDALTHAIFPGVVVGFLLGINFLLGAFVSGVIVAVFIAFIARNSQVSEDSAIGVLFTGAFSLGVALLSSVKSHGRSLEGFLFGDILGINVEDLVVTGLLTIFIVSVVFALRKELLLSSFDPSMAKAMGFPVNGLEICLYFIIAATVVVSLPAAGNILVLAFLVTPSATARLLTNRFYVMMPIAAAIGIISSVVGIYLDYYANVAGSAGVVVVATIFFITGLIFSPQYGLIVKWKQSRKIQQKIV